MAGQDYDSEVPSSLVGTSTNLNSVRRGLNYFYIHVFDIK